MRSVLCLALLLNFQIACAMPGYPDRLELLGQLENRQFKELDALLRSYQDNYEQGVGDERVLAFALDTLANSNPEYEALLHAWAELQPGSYVPYLVRAYYYYAVAWSWRGHRSEQETSDQRMVSMRDYLQLAASDITRAVKIKPRLSAADALALKVLMVLGQDEIKRETLAEALNLDPDSLLVRSSYLWSLKPEWGGRPEDLMQFITETAADAQRNPDLGSLLGYADYIFAESLAEQQRFEEAAQHFDFAVNKGADYIIYRERGINYYHLENFEKALQDFDHSLSLWPQDPGTLRWRSHTLQRMGNDEAALKDLDLAVRLAPMNRYVLMAHALLSRKMKRFEQVLGNYQQALYYNQHDADIWYERGMHYSHELINFDAARDNFKRATELDSENPAYWYEYAAVLHYKLDCEIVMPLERYLGLCAVGSECHTGELRWARHARDWLLENKRCAPDYQG